jgi:hypothetical protein
MQIEIKNKSGYVIYTTDIRDYILPTYYTSVAVREAVT